MRPLFRTSGATEKEKESQRISPVNKLLRKQLNIKMAELERSTSEIDAYNSAALVSIRNQLNANYYEPARSSSLSSLRSLLGYGSNQANNISSVNNPVSRTNDTSQRSLFSTPGQNGNANSISNLVRSSSFRSLPLSSSNQANNVSSIGNLVSRTNDTSQRPLFRTSGTNPNTAAYAAAKEKERQRILADNERLREQFNRRMAELERSTSEFDAYNEAALASIRKKLNTNYNDLYGRNR
jgi:hypothetical protein